MKKSSIVKASLCGGVALAIVATVNMPRVSSASLNAEKGLAGISITLDKYCTTEPQEAVTAEPTEVAVNEDAIASEAVVNEGSQYDDVAISIANEYVNVRGRASTDGRLPAFFFKASSSSTSSFICSIK